MSLPAVPRFAPWIRIAKSVMGLALAACTTEPLPAPTLEHSPVGGIAVVETELAGPIATVLGVPTYEQSGEAVHPDVVFFPEGWRGFRYWMAFTPYPGGREMHENPSLVVSQNGVDWEVPAGVTNPVFHRPIERDGYNSDPDLTYDASTDRLLMIYRQVRGGSNQIRASWSADGIKWSRPRLIFRRPNHGIISPTITLGADGKPRVWYVDAGPDRCARRTTRVMTQQGEVAALDSGAVETGWTEPAVAGLVQPGYFIWHLDVIYVPEKQEYWALYPAYRRGDCGARELFFATSADGITWRTFPGPMLRHEQQPWTQATLYRGSLLYDRTRDVVRVFLSGADKGPKWHLGYIEFPYRSLIDQLTVATDHPSAPRPPRAPGRHRRGR